MSFGSALMTGTAKVRDVAKGRRTRRLQGDSAQASAWGEPMSHASEPEGVPLNVWLPPTQPNCGHVVRRQLAARVVDAYAPVGGLVIDLLPGRGEAIGAVRAAGRRATAMPGASGCDGRRRRAGLSRLEDSADLVLALPAAMAIGTGRSRPFSSLAGRVLAGRAANLLRPGGYLVLGTVGPDESGADPIADAVAAITAEGFIYFQHLVALLRSDLDDDRTSEVEGRAACHVDLLVFERRRA